jgi:protein-disulfide isomerase
MLPRNRLLLPIASIVAMLIVGLSAWFALRDNSKASVERPAPVDRSEFKLEGVRDIQPKDHVFGNPNAPILFITYTDFTCLPCAEHHAIMRNLITMYGMEGEAAWVFRHMPMVSQSREAPMYALASECVADLAGNQAFWDFSDDLFKLMNPLTVPGPQELIDLAEVVGASRQEFSACMRSGTLMDKVEEDFDEITAAGVKGPPHTVILTPFDRQSFSGVRPFLAVAATLRAMIQRVQNVPLAPPSQGGGGNWFDDDPFAEPSETNLVPTRTPYRDRISTEEPAEE